MLERRVHAPQFLSLALTQKSNGINAQQEKESANKMKKTTRRALLKAKADEETPLRLLQRRSELACLVCGVTGQLEKGQTLTRKVGPLLS